MAAAYQTGSASSPTDLLQKLVTWLVAQGWTQNMSQADGTGWRAHLSKGGVYVNLRSTPGSETIWAGGVWETAPTIGIGLYTGTGYSGASAWNAQAGGPIGNGAAYTVGAFMQLPSGSISAYHLFDDGSDNIVVVVERTAGIFTNMGWGPSITKAGTFTGGAYFFGAMCGYYGGYTAGGNGVPSASAFCPGTHGDGVNSGNSTFVRADVDAFTSKWLGIGSTTNAVLGYTGKNAASPVFGSMSLVADVPQYGSTFQSRLTSALNAQANLLPIRVYAARDAGGYSLIGDVPNIFLSNATENGFSPSTVYPLGPDNYMLFHNFAVLKKA